MKALLLKTNGSVMVVELKPMKYKFQSMAHAIGADLIEFVDSRILGDDYCIVCDESGLLKESPEINANASWLLGYQKHGCSICGDAIIMRNLFTDDGINTVGLTDEDIKTIVDLLKASRDEIAKEYFLFMAKLH